MLLLGRIQRGGVERVGVEGVGGGGGACQDEGYNVRRGGRRVGVWVGGRVLTLAEGNKAPAPD